MMNLFINNSSTKAIDQWFVYGINDLCNLQMLMSARILHVKMAESVRTTKVPSCVSVRKGGRVNIVIKVCF